jgi:hypothetical protein
MPPARADGRPSTARQQQIRFVPAPFMLQFALLPAFSFWFHTRIGVSRYLDMVGVTGSIPVVPTTNSLFSQHFWNHPRPDRLGDHLPFSGNNTAGFLAAKGQK